MWYVRKIVPQRLQKSSTQETCQIVLDGFISSVCSIKRWFSKKINTTILSQRIIHVLISRMCQPNRWAHTVPCHANYCCSSPCCPRSTTLTPFNHMKFNKAFRIPYQIRQNSQLPPSFKSSMKGTNIFYGPNHRHYVTTLEANLRCLTWSLG